MSLSTWYEVCVSIDGKVVEDSSVRGNLEGAKREIQRFRAMYPDADSIFVRQYPKKAPANRRCRVLHTLTVHKGSTAQERRARGGSL